MTEIQFLRLLADAGLIRRKDSWVSPSPQRMKPRGSYSDPPHAERPASGRHAGSAPFRTPKKAQRRSEGSDAARGSAASVGGGDGDRCVTNAGAAIVFQCAVSGGGGVGGRGGATVRTSAVLRSSVARFEAACGLQEAPHTRRWR